MKPLEDLTFTDDFMFGYVMRQPEICKEMLERLLKIKIEKLEYPELQKSISGFYESKGVRLDVYVKDSDKIFDIEIQNNIEVALPERARYYQSMLDIDNLLKGQDYEDLKESFIIFICTFDPFNKGLPSYTFQNFCKENKTLYFGDKTTKLVFNAKAFEKEIDVDIKNLLKYISEKEPSDSFTDKINSLVKEAKHNQQLGSKYLTMNLHDRDLIKQTLKQGAEQKAIETAKNLLLKNIPKETIAECTGLSFETVENLEKEISAS